ncbi:S-layer homology domain-containing protein [Sporomusa acidovorans]|uniref:SLH domain-containing protein n=1 Tax=Sporomusa acidovorans (strain ATCC 49682 / DSM 3132 / Mol) TaxID=1123286 RepID=A0ABZ3IYB9_SPOA4|nr:S-layer homology domain-containing protein [Sporomusa acidovorans]OZC22170.1 outer membrane protein alpha precursor [Sporomusa acidovorans DSM 3132]SDE82239.1 S-layer homology domain-containing protein [Sporomusa acidovorans]
MRKAMILTLILACLLSIGGVALAANFTDVPAKHWAYDAVGQLYKAGLIDGYGDGTFRGDKPLTRYEFAFVTARALENYHKANVEQRALLDKLSVEFATELNNIGVRLTKLEKNQPNIKFTGSLRVRYNITDYTAPSTKTSDVYGQYNLRLEAAAKVDDNTTFNARFMSKVPDKKNLNFNIWQKFGEAGQSTETGTSTYGNAAIDRAYFQTKIGTVNAAVGRQPLKVDDLNFLFAGEIFNYDGVKANFKIDNLKVALTYGRFIKGANYLDARKNDITQFNNLFGDLDVRGADVRSNLGKLKWALSYYNFKNPERNLDALKWSIANLEYDFDNRFSLTGQLSHNAGVNFGTAGGGRNMYVLKAKYGNQTLGKKGDNNIVVQYVNAQANSVFNRLTNLPANSGMLLPDVVDYKEYIYQYNYAFSKNFTSTLEYAKVQAASNKDNNDKNQFRFITSVFF